MLLILIPVLLSALTSAQKFDFNNYTPLTSSGKIPPDLISFYLKSEENAPEIHNNREFVNFNAIEFGNMFASGKVIYNDPISLYAKKILDTLLYKRPEIRRKMRVFTLRSSIVNAYTTNDGKIFITTGLMARLNSEAELAFILAHEVVHYINKHVYDTYLFNKILTTIFTQKNKPQKNDITKKDNNSVFARYIHSREKEFEADKIGLTIFLETEYPHTVVDSVFRTLDGSELPVGNLAFKKAFFETSSFAIRDAAWLDASKIEQPAVDTNYNEFKSTHPNSISRKRQLQIDLEKEKFLARVKKYYLFTEFEFNFIKTISKYELINILYLEQSYEEAIYHSYLLINEYGKSNYLQKMIIKSLYALLTDTDYRSHYYYNKKRGNIYQLSHLLKYLDRDEIEEMTLLYALELNKTIPEDKELQLLINNVYSLLDNKNRSYYYSDKQKNAKLELLKKNNSDSTSSSYRKEFNDIIKKAVFSDYLYTGHFIDDALSGNKLPFKDEEQQELDNKSMYVIPYVLISDSTSGKTFYELPKQTIQDFAGKSTHIADKLGAKLHFISTYNLTDTSVEQYNNYAVLNDWLNMSRDNGNNLYSSNKEFIALQNKYHARYLCISGVYFYKNKFKTRARIWLLNTLFVPPVLGIVTGTVKSINANYTSVYTTLVYDLKTGKIISNEFDGSYRNKKTEVKEKLFINTLRYWKEINH